MGRVGNVGARLRAAGIIVLFLAIIGGLPGLTPRAVAEPRVVTFSTPDVEPFVITHDDITGNKFDAVAFDAPVLAYFVAHDGAKEATLVGTVFKHTDYGIAFRNGSELRKQADEALLKMREDGDFQMIKEKWFGPDA